MPYPGSSAVDKVNLVYHFHIQPNHILYPNSENINIGRKQTFLPVKITLSVHHIPVDDGMELHAFYVFFFVVVVALVFFYIVSYLFDQALYMLCCLRANMG